jgi:hypothetical protein
MDLVGQAQAIEKRCTKCSELKPISEFYKHKSSPDGRTWYCKVCINGENKRRSKERKPNPNARACTKCGLFKEASEYRDFRNQCKACEKINDEAYREEHKEELRARYRTYDESHREERKAYRETPKGKAVGRRRSLKHKYGISPADFEKLIELQKGKCKCCGRKFEGRGLGAKAPVVDHCHNVGHVRGIICVRCNKAEGVLKTPETVLALYHYMLQNELFYGGVN